MEELRSTEILDKEILEDSRKKAERILINSAGECESILAEVSKQIAIIRAEKKNLYDTKVASYKRDTEASLPLEKQRYLVAFEKKAVGKAITAYLVALPKVKKMALLEKLLNRYKEHLAGHKINIYTVGFKSLDIKNLVTATLKNCVVLQCEDMNVSMENELKSEFGTAEGMLIETEDKSRRCRVSIGELTAQMIDMYSYEITSTLFCGRLPE